MERFVSAVMFVASLVGVASAESIGINFGNASSDPDWNNMGGLNAEISDLVYLDGSYSGIGIDISDEYLFNGTNTNGNPAPGAPASDYFPEDVTNTSYYGNTELWNGRTNEMVEILLYNLDPSVGYQSTFYAVRVGASDNRETEYEVVGATTETVTLDAAANGRGDGGMIAQTGFLLPDASGEINLTIQPGVNNDNSYGFFYLTGLHIEEGAPGGGNELWAGDADQDLDFDQLDLVQVQIGAKYLTGAAATWGEGDWNGAPGGEAGSPPSGNGLFDQVDIIAALAPGHYLTGPYGAVADHPQGLGNATLVYDPNSGELAVEVGATELTSVNIDSAAGIFTGDAAQNLGGSFDNDSDDNIFKATFGGSFGSLSFGNVAQAGLAEDLVLNDLTVVGSLSGGGELGSVDLIYVPEPSTMMLLAVAFAALLAFRGGR